MSLNSSYLVLNSLPVSSIHPLCKNQNDDIHKELQTLQYSIDSHTMSLPTKDPVTSSK